MAERLIEFYTSWPTEKIAETLTELSAGRTWVTATPDEQNHVRLLADASETEKLVDDIRLRFASDGTFRLFLLPVEASLPRPEKPEPEELAPEEPEAPEPPPPQRVSREELYADLTEGLSVNWQFMVMVALAAIVAAIGLVRDSATVIIAAMVIAPLLKPNLALALGTTLGDLDLTRTSIRVNLAGMALALGLAAALGALLPIDTGTLEIELRTWVGPGDILLALASGVAAALSVTTAASSALIGVMVAVALMPPLVVAGLLLGAGQLDRAGGAAELLLVNVVCVNLAGVATFWIQKVVPARYWEAARARTATRRAVLVWAGLLVALIAWILTQDRSDLGPAPASPTSHSEDAEATFGT
ncbi:MAG: TIGR00341 family protein [Acidobacteria bacterium]|jgi:uncharacterized hydrophobic protein (TIGR00341 family)|nr:TIGR00341 family protein [Acidobacteriota bacterium]